MTDKPNANPEEARRLADNLLEISALESLADLEEFFRREGL